MSKTKQITILPKHLIIGLLVFIVLVAVLYAFIPGLVNWFSQPRPAELAASEGAQAFLSTDINLGRSAWEEYVCKVSSEDGCLVFKNTFATMVWAGVEKNQIRQTCQAVGAKLVRDVSTEDEQRQIWQVTLDCINLNTNESNAGDVYVSMVKVKDDWKFERILFEQEVQHAEE